MSVVNSFSSGTTIASADMNANFSDVASEMTNSVAKDGQTSMTGPLKAASGSASAPGITFASDTDTGFFRKSGNTIGLASGGAEVATLGPNGLADANSNAIVGIPVGSMMMYGATTAPTGWVRMNGRTIGNASSSATERANADTESLFAFVWNNYSNSVCAVGGGRGVSAAADYAANKAIAMPDARGRAFFGLDDMGNSAAGRLGTVLTDETTNGASGGAETATIAQNQLPNVAPTVQITDPGHKHVYKRRGAAGGADGTGSAVNHASTETDTDTTTVTTGITATASSINGNVTQQAMATLPPAFLTTFIMKL